MLKGIYSRLRRSCVIRIINNNMGDKRRAHISIKRTLQFMIMFSTLPRSVFLSNISIKWELFTKPAVFGQSIALECKLPRYECCDKQVRRWLGGNDLHLLVMNGISANNNKYSEVLNATSFSSQLQISHFEEKDINVPYECSYGFETYVDILRLTEKDFVSLPMEPVNENITSYSSNNIVFNFFLEHVFPRPMCSALVNNQDINNNMETSFEMQGIFYAAFITINYMLIPGMQCPFMLNLLCKIGMSMFTLERSVNCTEVPKTGTKDGDDLVYKWVIIGGLSIVLITFFLVFSSISIMLCRQKDAKDNHTVRLRALLEDNVDDT